MNDISIFYHLFMVNNWRHVFEWHIDLLWESGLYDACEHVCVGAIYRDCRDLMKLDSVLRDNDKITLLFARDLAAVPVEIWPSIRLADGRIGESETILRMVEYAQQRDADANYFFLHSKGVTNPPTKRRRKHLAYFVGKGFDPTESNERANDFVLKDMGSVISSWREYLKALETSSFRYYIFNFFCISGGLLRQFDFDEYIALHRELAPPAHRPHRLEMGGDPARHVFALFPIKLYTFMNGIEMEKPPYAYIDVSM